MDGDERWRVLQLHVEDQVPLAAFAPDARISAQTLQRWHQFYRVGGIVARGLARAPTRERDAPQRSLDNEGFQEAN
ncbi:hypothetical protein [Cryobacterium sp. Y11]|uniref:hypothetical protein n=1 Tax=Cryobacterium sp. Y11 TaxID=2045016 RepID=UPI000CE456CA|nr:hypothetical protein [Cryobacterium sp. Y11]